MDVYIKEALFPPSLQLLLFFSSLKRNMLPSDHALAIEVYSRSLSEIVTLTNTIQESLS